MKKVLFSVVIAVVLLFAVSGIALADDPTEVSVTWDGTGWIGANVNTGDSSTSLNTEGTNINGSLNVKDYNDNPYSYTVDTFSSLLNASVSNGGYISLITNRLTSKVSMYGLAGQQSGTLVGINDGTASVALRTWTNYAAMKDPTYGYQLPGGHNITVSSSLYTIDRWITDGQGNAGYIVSNGNGSAVLDCMSTEASGNGGVRFGWGCGCFTDANYTATGSGHFNVTGIGNTQVTFGGLGITSGGGALSIIADFINGFSIGDYSLTAK